MKINVMISESAGFTPAQTKKIVIGAKLIEHKVGQLIKRGSPFYKSKIQHTITDVELTKSGSIKSVSTEWAYVMQRGEKTTVGSKKEAKFTPTQLAKLLAAPIPKTTDGKPSRAIRFGDAVGEKAQDVNVRKSIRDLDAQIAELQSKREALQSKLNKQAAITAKQSTKAKEMQLAEKGIYFSVEVTKPLRAGEEKTVKPSLKAARNVRPQLTSSGSIYAVEGKKKTRVMTFASTNPITKQSIKGKAWFFVSKEAEKKYS
jgi:hypothetical protein